MKMTSLTIAPTSKWSPVGEDNRLKAVVKLNSDGSTIECVLSEESMLKMLDLCAAEIAEQAKKNVDQFVSAVTALEGGKSAALIGGN